MRLTCVVAVDVVGQDTMRCSRLDNHHRRFDHSQSVVCSEYIVNWFALYSDQPHYAYTAISSAAVVLSPHRIVEMRICLARRRPDALSLKLVDADL